MSGIFFKKKKKKEYSISWLGSSGECRAVIIVLKKPFFPFYLVFIINRLADHRIPSKFLQNSFKILLFIYGFMIEIIVRVVWSKGIP